MPAWIPWIRETLRSGTIASLVMMPPGFLFQALGWRVGHYGPKFARLWVDAPGPAFLFAQHLLIGWVSTLPLLWLLARTPATARPLATGAAYGAAYYVLVNALALPLLFGDPLPWRLGVTTVIPSLVVHVVFGLSIGWTAARWARGQAGRTGPDTALTQPGRSGNQPAPPAPAPAPNGPGPGRRARRRR